MAPPGLSANDTTGMFFYFAATIYSLYIAVAGNNIRFLLAIFPQTTAGKDLGRRRV